METPADVLVYFDQIGGDARQARLLSINPLGFYEVVLQTAGGPRRALLPLAKTFVLATEIEPAVEATEIER